MAPVDLLAPAAVTTSAVATAGCTLTGRAPWWAQALHSGPVRMMIGVRPLQLSLAAGTIVSDSTFLCRCHSSGAPITGNDSCRQLPSSCQPDVSAIMNFLSVEGAELIAHIGGASRPACACCSHDVSCGYCGMPADWTSPWWAQALQSGPVRMMIGVRSLQFSLAAGTTVSDSTFLCRCPSTGAPMTGNDSCRQLPRRNSRSPAP